MEILKLIKQDLRITHNKLDELLLEEVEVCKSEMKRVGINPDTSDHSIINIIKLFVKASQNFQNQGELYHQRYTEMLKAVSLNKERALND